MLLNSGLTAQKTQSTPNCLKNSKSSSVGSTGAAEPSLIPGGCGRTVAQADRGEVSSFAPVPPSAILPSSRRVTCFRRKMGALAIGSTGVYQDRAGMAARRRFRHSSAFPGVLSYNFAA